MNNGIALWGTPDGGLVTRETDSFVFVSPPAGSTFKPGDKVPDGESLTTKNVLAMLANEAIIGS